MLNKLNTPGLALLAICSNQVEALGWSNTLHKLSAATLSLLTFSSDHVEAFGWQGIMPTSALALLSLLPEKAEAAPGWTNLFNWGMAHFPITSMAESGESITSLIMTQNCNANSLNFPYIHGIYVNGVGASTP